MLFNDIAKNVIFPRYPGLIGMPFRWNVGSIYKKMSLTCIVPIKEPFGQYNSSYIRGPMYLKYVVVSVGCFTKGKHFWFTCDVEFVLVVLFPFRAQHAA